MKLIRIAQKYYSHEYPYLYSYLADVIENKNFNILDNSLIAKPGKKG